MRGRVLRWVTVLAAVVLVAAGVWVVRFSPLLEVRAVAIHRLPSSGGVLSEAQIRDAAQVRMSVPMVTESLEGVASRVRSLKPVATVQVHRSWPHTLTIEVTERTAAYAWKSGSGYQLVDPTGFAFLQVGSVPKGLVPVTAAGASPTLLTGLAVVVDTLPRDLVKKVDRVEAPSPDQVTVYLDSGVRVIWGNSADSDLKVQITQALLKVKKVKVIDVSAPGQPTTR